MSYLVLFLRLFETIAKVIFRRQRTRTPVPGRMVLFSSAKRDEMTQILSTTVKASGKYGRLSYFNLCLRYNTSDFLCSSLEVKPREEPDGALHLDTQPNTTANGGNAGEDERPEQLSLLYGSASHER